MKLGIILKKNYLIRLNFCSILRSLSSSTSSQEILRNRVFSNVYSVQDVFDHVALKRRQMKENDIADALNSLWQLQKVYGYSHSLELLLAHVHSIRSSIEYDRLLTLALNRLNSMTDEDILQILYVVFKLNRTSFDLNDNEREMNVRELEEEVIREFHTETMLNRLNDLSSQTMSLFIVVSKKYDQRLLYPHMRQILERLDNFMNENDVRSIQKFRQLSICLFNLRMIVHQEFLLKFCRIAEDVMKEMDIIDQDDLSKRKKNNDGIETFAPIYYRLPYIFRCITNDNYRNHLMTIFNRYQLQPLLHILNNYDDGIRPATVIQKLFLHNNILDDEYTQLQSIDCNEKTIFKNEETKQLPLSPPSPYLLFQLFKVLSMFERDHRFISPAMLDASSVLYSMGREMFNSNLFINGNSDEFIYLFMLLHGRCGDREQKFLMNLLRPQLTSAHLISLTTLFRYLCSLSLTSNTSENVYELILKISQLLANRIHLLGFNDFDQMLQQQKFFPLHILHPQYLCSTFTNICHRLTQSSWGNMCQGKIYSLHWLLAFTQQNIEEFIKRYRFSKNESIGDDEKIQHRSKYIQQLSFEQKRLQHLHQFAPNKFQGLPELFIFPDGILFNRLTSLIEQTSLKNLTNLYTTNRSLLHSIQHLKNCPIDTSKNEDSIYRFHGYHTRILARQLNYLQSSLTTHLVNVPFQISSTFSDEDEMNDDNVINHHRTNNTQWRSSLMTVDNVNEINRLLWVYSTISWNLFNQKDQQKLSNNINVASTYLHELWKGNEKRMRNEKNLIDLKKSSHRKNLDRSFNESLRNLSYLRIYSKNIFNLFFHFIQNDYFHPNLSINYFLAAYHLNHSFPQHSSSILYKQFNSILQNTIDLDKSSVLLVLSFANLIIHYEFVNEFEDFFRQIFSKRFLERFDQFITTPHISDEENTVGMVGIELYDCRRRNPSEMARKKLLQLNQSVSLHQIHDIPFFHSEKMVMDLIDVNERTYTTRKNFICSLLNTLQSMYGNENITHNYLLPPFFIHVPIRLILRKKDGIPVRQLPSDPETSLEQFHKFVFIPLIDQDVALNERCHYLSDVQLLMNQLKRMNYSIIPVSHYQWNQFTSINQQTLFMENLIQSTM
ncbi:hypothetical protein SNEBB_005873 [Seison nebaliae]|nr:hypothetical protein SNEBB_005873 [Seison nebaliae]